MLKLYFFCYVLSISYSAAAICTTAALRHANQKKKFQADIQNGTALAPPLVLKTPGTDVQYFNFRLCSPPNGLHDKYNVVDTLSSFNQMPANADYGGSGGCGVCAKKLPIAVTSAPIELSSPNKELISKASALLSKPCYMLTRTGNVFLYYLALAVVFVFVTTDGIVL